MAAATFRDPLGLVGRLLRDPNPTARRALLRAGAAVAARPYDRWLRREERDLIEAVTPCDDHRMLLIVGAPRSGTTLVAQTLVHHLDVSFPSNLGAIFPSAPIAAQRRWPPPLRSSAAEPDRIARERRNFYGQTPGLHDHNDAFHIWDRWLGPNRYHATTTMAPGAVDDMQRFFSAWHSTFGRPFVNKNNRNTTALAPLLDALPGALGLIVTRDPDAVARSLRIARQVAQGNARRAWGLLAREASSDDDIDLAIAEQLAAIDASLDQVRTKVSPERLVTIDFDVFRRDPAALTDLIADRLGIGRCPSPIASFD